MLRAGGDELMVAENSGSVRVIACCGNMVVVYGMERMSFEILRVLRESGAEVHCVLNEWERHRIEPLAESIGASWSTGIYGYPLVRTRNPLRLLWYCWKSARTSFGFLRDQKRFRATHVFVPEYVAALRNAPALLLMKARGVPVILRLPTAPERGRFYDLLWRFVLPRLATTIVAQSEFTRGRCEQAGVPSGKTVMIKNTIPRRSCDSDADRAVIDLVRSRRTLLCVGQIAPFKGTHIAVNATLALLERGEDLQLVVAGSEPVWPPERVSYFRKMRNEVAARGLEDRVHFVGNVSNVLKLMESSFVFLAPILQEESFGLVMLEAKSAGLPVVAFRRGAIPELVEHEETGFLCRGLDRDSLIEGIDYFLSDAEARERASDASRRSYADPANDSAHLVFASAWRGLFSLSE